MSRSWVLILAAAAAAVSVSAEPPAEPPATPAAEPVRPYGDIPPDTSWVFSLEVGSRLYPEWKEPHEVKLGQSFYIGDTQFTGLVARFVPDFKIHEGKPVNFSPFLNNPAVRVFVHADSGAVDSAWAFLNFPPHFSPKSFYTFQLKEIRGYAPPADSAAGSGRPPAGTKEEGR